MNLHKLLLFFPLFFIVISLRAQTDGGNRAQAGGGNIEGWVGDDSAHSIESATVSLLVSKDSILRQLLTDKQGFFHFRNIAAGKYILLISSLGFAAYRSGSFVVSPGARINRDSVRLQRLASDLEVVTIVKKRPPVEFHADKTVINVESSVSNTGATAMEVLKKSPGVMVDKDGNISLKGKSNVMVMLDDKLTYVSGEQLADLLNGMSASQLDQIEIMTNPSAKFDAAGNAGIINIKTKKNRARGFNGNATLGYGQGQYPRYNGGLNLNYRSANYNFFFSYNRNYERGYEEIIVLRKYFDPDGKTIHEYVASDNLQRLKDQTHTLKAGMDYFLSPRTTLGIVATAFRTVHTINSNSAVYVEDTYRKIDSTSYDAVGETKKILNGGLNLNFQHRIDSSRQLGGNLDHIQYHFTDGQHFFNNTYLPDGSPSSLNQLKGDLPVDIYIYSGKLDYTQTLKHDMKLEGGWKSSLVKTDNIASYYNLDSAGWQPDYGKTNHFIYHENVNAAYVNLQRTIGKWSFQAGLRYENTVSRGHQLGNPGKPDSSFHREYNNLFPTVYIILDQTKNSQWTLSTGRRIDRPAYQDLNPFLFYVNQYTYRTGNPFIVPQYTNNIEVSWIYKSVVSTTINYSNTKNYFNSILRATHDTTIIMSGNIRKYEGAGISSNAALVVNHWWTAILEANLNYIVENAYIPNSRINSAAVSGQLNVNNQLTFKKGWSGELSGFYNTYTVEGQNTSEGFGQVSVGVSKQLHQWTAKMTVNNIFLTNNYRGGVQYQDVQVHYDYKSDSRVLNLALIYRFGKPQKEGNQRHQRDVQEENRVKGNK